MLSEWEEHEFANIEEGLAHQDPELATRLGHRDDRKVPRARRSRRARTLSAVAIVLGVPSLMLLISAATLATEAVFFAYGG